MSRYAKLLVCALALLKPTAAMAWEYAEWGMSPEEVKAASSGIAIDNPETDPGSITYEDGRYSGLVVAPAVLDGVPLEATFGFSTDSRLSFINIRPEAIANCGKFSSALSASYGEGEASQSEYFDSIRWETDSTIIVFISSSSVMCGATIRPQHELATHVELSADAMSPAQDCRDIADAADRLACYDAESVGVLPSATVNTGGWDISESRSAIDDSPAVTALLLAEDVRGSGIGNQDLYLILRCLEDTTSVVIGTSMFMTDDAVPVTTRLDSAPASTSRWSVSTSYKSVGLWNGASAIPFVISLSSADNLVVRIEERNRIEGQFDLTGIRGAAEKISTACNWALPTN